MKSFGSLVAAAMLFVCTVVVCLVLVMDRDTVEYGFNSVMKSYAASSRPLEPLVEVGSREQLERRDANMTEVGSRGVWPYFGADLPPNRPKLQTCTDPVKHFVFIKTHKTGSTTVCALLYRFGVSNGLNFVLPRVPVNVGWPSYLRTGDYIPLKEGIKNFDVLADHTVYHRRIIDNLMPADSAYITQLRHPLHHVKSVFNWYNVPRQLNMDIRGKNPLEEFLKNPLRYELLQKLMSRDKNDKHHPYSFTRNFMSFDLGFPPGLAEDMEAAQAYVERLDREFDLVLILEYLDESLVLLKRTLCWTVLDIVYNIFNESPGYRFDMELTPEMDVNYRKWSKVDYLLYEHFNTSLWNRVSELGDDFLQEVAHFVTVKNQVKAFCEDGKKDQLVIPASKWDNEFSVDQKFCRLFKTTRMSFYKYLAPRQVDKELLNNYTSKAGAPGKGDKKKQRKEQKQKSGKMRNIFG
ncbi:galactose-3-O-sulfotransferase 2-like isoform X1 [Branchiostoma floridae x Branchiostoma belcheri]